MRWVFFSLLLLHGAMHVIGVAKSFGLGAFPQISHSISKSMGLGWLAATAALLTAGAMLAGSHRAWWGPAAAGVVLSQFVIFSAWGDARFGTGANVLILLGAIYGFASSGPTSFRAEFDRETTRRLAAMPPRAPLVTQADLASLPEPVACYLRRAGVVGQPRATHVRAVWRGRIRGAADDPWMEFTAEQYNFLTEPSRFFLMAAKRSGLPVDVYHAFTGGEATMNVKLASLVSMAMAAGRDFTRAETVTLLNDMSVLAPAGLLADAVVWEAIDASSARAAYTIGEQTVHAVLRFDEECDLVDFVSDDRLAASSDGEKFIPQRWSTPLRDHRAFGPYRVAAHGEGRWHPDEGEFAYLEIDLLELQVNAAPR